MNQKLKDSPLRRPLEESLLLIAFFQKNSLMKKTQVIKRQNLQKSLK